MNGIYSPRLDTWSQPSTNMKTCLVLQNGRHPKLLQNDKVECSFKEKFFQRGTKETKRIGPKREFEGKSNL